MTPPLSDPAMQLGLRLADHVLPLYFAGLLAVVLDSEEILVRRTGVWTPLSFGLATNAIGAMVLSALGIYALARWKRWL